MRASPPLFRKRLTSSINPLYRPKIYREWEEFPDRVAALCDELPSPLQSRV